MKKSGITVISTIIGIVTGVTVTKLFSMYKQENSTKEIKFKSYYYLLNQWLEIKQKGLNLEKYFIDNNIKQIAIYGMGELGLRLYEELKDTSIEVKYAIDKTGDSTISEIETFYVSDNLEKVDAIIVTAVFDFDKIETELKKNVTYTIISLDDVIFNLD